ncbi:PKD domain-containing protein [Methanoculleus frigidifontis]|nr:PKD domain-containing protein [Methanoculleus sp. FWC-SCC1]
MIGESGECKYTYACPAADRNVAAEYTVVALDVLYQEIGYYAQEITSGRAFGDLAELEADDSWTGGSVVLIDDVDLGGYSLKIGSTAVTGSVDADTGMATAIRGNGEIQANNTVFRDADLLVQTPADNASCLDNISASNCYISITGNQTCVTDSLFTGERGILRLNGDLIFVRGNSFTDIGNGLELEGFCCAVSENRFSRLNGTASAAGVAITMNGVGGGVFGGGVSNNTIEEFKRAMEITGSVRVSDNVIRNITSAKTGASVVWFYNAEGSVFERNIIVDTDQPKAQAVLYLTDTGKVTIQNNTITGGIQGVKLWNTKGENVIENNTLADMTYYGISLQNAAPAENGIEQANAIADNVITGAGLIAETAGYGILIDDYHETIISDNFVMDFCDGIVIRASDDTWVFSNTLIPTTGHGVAIYKEQTVYPFLEGAESNYVWENMIAGGSTGILVEGSGSQISTNTVTGYTGTGIQIEYGDQNLVRDNLLMSRAQENPVDIRIGTRPDAFPDNLVLESNTLARDVLGKNMTTFSLSALTEGVTIRAVNAPPQPPETPDYSCERADIGQWLSIRSGNFTNQEDVSLNLTFHYKPGELKGVGEESLLVWQYNGTRWDAGDGDPSWNGTRWLDNATHEVGVQVTHLRPWDAGTAVFAPLGEPLRADFTADPARGQAPLTVRFTDLSEGGPTGWSWSFGDGATSTEQHPVHTYTAAGSYTVNLTVTASGDSDTLVRADCITVTPRPLSANFTANRTCGVAPLAVQFTDLSEGDPTSWSWTFGDDATSTEQHPVHTYAAAGNYTVALTINGGGETCTRPAYVRVTPVLFGDANGDDAVNQADTLRVLKEVVGLVAKPASGTEQFQKTDVHANGIIEVGDALFIAQYNAGLRDVWFGIA